MENQQHRLEERRIRLDDFYDNAGSQLGKELLVIQNIADRITITIPKQIVQRPASLQLLFPCYYALYGPRTETLEHGRTCISRVCRRVDVVSSQIELLINALNTHRVLPVFNVERLAPKLQILIGSQYSQATRTTMNACPDTINMMIDDEDEETTPIHHLLCYAAPRLSHRVD